MIEVRFLVLLCAGVFADQEALAPCEGVAPMEDFHVLKNDGVWYVVETYPTGSSAFETCIIKYFEDLEDASVRIKTFLVDQKGEPITNDGFAKFVGDEARFTENYRGLQFEEKWILDTDYDTYSVHYSCGDISPFKVNNVWIMAKTKQPGAETMEKAHKAVLKNGLSVENLQPVDWKTCPDFLSR